MKLSGRDAMTSACAPAIGMRIYVAGLPPAVAFITTWRLMASYWHAIADDAFTR